MSAAAAAHLPASVPRGADEPRRPWLRRARRIGAGAEHHGRDGRPGLRRAVVGADRGGAAPGRMTARGADRGGTRLHRVWPRRSARLTDLGHVRECAPMWHEIFGVIAVMTAATAVLLHSWEAPTWAIAAVCVLSVTATVLYSMSVQTKAVRPGPQISSSYSNVSFPIARARRSIQSTSDEPAF